MAVSYLESLAWEYCEFVKGYYVKRNVSIKKYTHKPGPDLELDIIAYDEERGIHIIYELSEGWNVSWSEFVNEMGKKCAKILELDIGASEVFFVSGYAKRPRFNINEEISSLNRKFRDRGLSISYLNVPTFLGSVITGVRDKLRTVKSIPTIYPSLRLIELLIENNFLVEES